MDVESSLGKDMIFSGGVTLGCTTAECYTIAPANDFGLCFLLLSFHFIFFTFMIDTAATGVLKKP